MGYPQHIVAVLALLASASADCPAKKFDTNASGVQVSELEPGFRPRSWWPIRSELSPRDRESVGE